MVVKQASPAARDRAQRRVRAITIASAAGAGVLTLAGAAVTAGTFGGRTVGATQAASAPAASPTLDPSTGLQPPAQPPTDAFGQGGGGQGGPPVVTGGS